MPANVIDATTTSTGNRYYRRIGIMAGSAIVLSAVIIGTWHRVQAPEVSNSIVIAAVTLMPYMISAVVAAMTAIGIISIVPLMTGRQSAQLIQQRIRRMGEGDFAISERVECKHDYLKEVAHELNYTIADLGSQMARLKIIHRQQWDQLELIRRALNSGDCQTAKTLIEKVEDDWDRIVEIEQRFRT